MKEYKNIFFFYSMAGQNINRVTKTKQKVNRKNKKSSGACSSFLSALRRWCEGEGVRDDFLADFVV